MNMNLTHVQRNINCSFGVVSSRVWFQILVMTLMPSRKSLNHNYCVKSALCSTLIKETSVVTRIRTHTVLLTPPELGSSKLDNCGPTTSLTPVLLVQWQSKHPCLQVSSGLQSTAVKFTYEASLVSLPETSENNTTPYPKIWFWPTFYSNQRTRSLGPNIVGCDTCILSFLIPPYSWYLQPSHTILFMRHPDSMVGCNGCRVGRALPRYEGCWLSTYLTG